MELKPCPFCGGAVSFHKDDDCCPYGCHQIECKNCGLCDMSKAADPDNKLGTLDELRFAIAEKWNRRATDENAAYERAAEICDTWSGYKTYQGDAQGACDDCAAAIRALKK